MLLYDKIAQLLEKRISDGLYPLNSRLPSEETLSKELKVSRPTIKKAVSILESRKILQCRSAIGSFVMAKPENVSVVGYIAPYLNDPFHAEVVSELGRQSRERGCGLLVAEGGISSESLSLAVNHLIGSGANGLLVSVMPEQVATQLVDRSIVYCGGVPEIEADKVTVDSVAGTFDLMDHLYGLGVRRFGYAFGEKTAMNNNVRYKAFRQYLDEKNLESRPSWHQSSLIPGEDGGRVCFENFMRQGGLPDAILCYNDWTAFGLMRAAREAGLKIPEQLKVTGFDNLSLNRYVPVPVTTVDYGIPEMVAAALQLLSERESNPAKAFGSRLLKGKLVICQSTIDKQE